MHSGPFGCLTKLGAKRAEPVQKFVPQSRVEIFRNERTRSTPLDPKLTIWCISYYFGCTRDCLVALQNLMQNGPNKCKSSCHEVASEFFATNAPDPPHWTLNSCFGAFRTIGCIWDCFLPYNTQCKTGRASAKVGATKSHWNFSQRKHPIHPIGP